MYKIGSFENEIYQSMQKKLASNHLEAKYGFNKLAQAADYLNAAAEVFEKAGMYQEANEIVQVIKDLANQLSK